MTGSADILAWEQFLRTKETVAHNGDLRYNPWRGHSFVWIYIC